MATSEAELLRAACCVAGLDGEISKHEKSLLLKLKERAGVGDTSFRAMLDRARSDPSYYEDVLEVARSDAHQVIKVLAAIARADGEVCLNERVVIRFFAERLGVDTHEVDKLLEQPT